MNANEWAQFFSCIGDENVSWPKPYDIIDDNDITFTHFVLLKCLRPDRLLNYIEKFCLKIFNDNSFNKYDQHWADGDINQNHKLMIYFGEEKLLTSNDLLHEMANIFDDDR